MRRQPVSVAAWIKSGTTKHFGNAITCLGLASVETTYLFYLSAIFDCCHECYARDLESGQNLNAVNFYVG
jgi:hypothetical protein